MSSLTFRTAQQAQIHLTRHLRDSLFWLTLTPEKPLVKFVDDYDRHELNARVKESLSNIFKAKAPGVVIESLSADYEEIDVEILPKSGRRHLYVIHAELIVKVQLENRKGAERMVIYQTANVTIENGNISFTTPRYNDPDVEKIVLDITKAMYTAEHAKKLAATMRDEWEWFVAQANTKEYFKARLLMALAQYAETYKFHTLEIRELNMHPIRGHQFFSTEIRLGKGSQFLTFPVNFFYHSNTLIQS